MSRADSMPFLEHYGVAILPALVVAEQIGKDHGRDLGVRATSGAGTPAGDGRKTRRVDRSRGGRPAPAVPRCSPFLGEPFRGRTRG